MGLTDEHIVFLISCFERRIQSQLLYRASSDGFTPQAFHATCDKKGPTLTLIRSDKGKLFGGYTGLNWDSESGYLADAGAFLFSLSKMTYHGVKKKAQSTYNDIYSNIVFGVGPDISIHIDCLY